MRSAPVVMRDPLLEDSPKVVPAQGDQVIQALAPDGPDGSLADRIGLRAQIRRLDHAQAHVRGCPIKFLREDPTSVVDEKSITVVREHALKARPGGCKLAEFEGRGFDGPG